jgi:hypothetical protein
MRILLQRSTRTHHGEAVVYASGDCTTPSPKRAKLSADPEQSDEEHIIDSQGTTTVPTTSTIREMVVAWSPYLPEDSRCAFIVETGGIRGIPDE